MKNQYDVIVVGAGPAGMMAAIAAAQHGVRVALLEKNNILGKKLAITGGGRCNLTSAIPIADFFDKIPRNAKFLYKSLNRFTNEDLVEFFRMRGVSFHSEGDKLYPTTNDAKTIIVAMEKELSARAVEVIINCEMKSFEGSTEQGFMIRSTTGAFVARRIILASGGYSFPATGSDGAVQEQLADKKIEIKKPLPSLVRIHSNASWVTNSSGISVEQARLTLYVAGKKIKGLQGQLLFTHTGISGPVAMNLTSYMIGESLSEVRVIADLLPQYSEEELVTILRESRSKGIENKLSGLLPKNLLKNIFFDVGEIDLNNLRKKEMKALICRLKEASIPITGFGGIREAIVTRGGIAVKEISPASMELKKIVGVYVAGEMMDVDALTGGYNLQIAFSTGFLAGEMAAKSISQAV